MTCTGTLKSMDRSPNRKLNSVIFRLTIGLQHSTKTTQKNLTINTSLSTSIKSYHNSTNKKPLFAFGCTITLFFPKRKKSKCNNSWLTLFNHSITFHINIWESRCSITSQQAPTTYKHCITSWLSEHYSSKYKAKKSYKRCPIMAQKLVCCTK